MFGLISLIGITAGLVNDARIHNQKYFGTEREIQRHNPEIQRNRLACQEIYERVQREKALRDIK